MDILHVGEWYASAHIKTTVANVVMWLFTQLATGIMPQSVEELWEW